MRLTHLHRALFALALAPTLSLCGCTDESTTPLPPPPADAGSDAPPVSTGALCKLPGAIQWLPEGGKTVVPGGPASPDLSFLTLPPGFCARYFGNVGNARQLRFAPGGELFVASPTTGTTGGGPGGKAAIVILPDDDNDGLADAPITFLDKIPSTQGLLFTKDSFYYQNDTRILKMPYAAGDRAPGPSTEVANITIYTSSLHWPKSLDEADDGTIYVGNGGDQGEVCDPARPFRGGILKLDGSPGGTPVAKGLRNPIAVRCSRGHNLCFAAELAKDYSALDGGREKLIPIRQGDDWGFPCCATKDLPHTDVMPVPDCSGVVPDDASFRIGDTPFAFDFELGTWPEPWKSRVFVPLHGAAGSWVGARLVAIALDPVSGLPLPSSNLDGSSSGGMADFAIGWDDGTLAHGRPAAVAFASDGRLFLASDTTGDIFWIAPLDL